MAKSAKVLSPASIGPLVSSGTRWLASGFVARLLDAPDGTVQPEVSNTSLLGNEPEINFAAAARQLQT